METLDCIYERRSIRKYKNRKISAETLRKIMEAATLSPSGKNKQPWKFIVLSGEKKDGLMKVMEKKIPEIRKYKNPGSYEGSVKAMVQSSTVILVFNTGIQKNSFFNLNPYINYGRIVDIQSIGGAIQTILLVSQNFGLGSLWICDTIYARKEICEFVNRKEELIAGIALGYSDEFPNPRPRKAFDETVEWM